MTFCPEHPKRDQNPKFTPLSETTSIPIHFMWESPPRLKSVVIENIHTNTKGNLRGWLGVFKGQICKEKSEAKLKCPLDWWGGGGGSNQEILCGRHMDIFRNSTILRLPYVIICMLKRSCRNYIFLFNTLLKVVDQFPAIISGFPKWIINRYNHSLKFLPQSLLTLEMIVMVALNNYRPI